jgi:hypothetical protein
MPHNLGALTHAENIRELASLKLRDNLGVDHGLVVLGFVRDLEVCPTVA